MGGAVINFIISLLLFFNNYGKTMKKLRVHQAKLGPYQCKTIIKFN